LRNYKFFILLLLLAGCSKKDKFSLAQTFLKGMEPLKALAVLEGDSSYNAIKLKIEIYFSMDDPLDGLKLSKDALKMFPEKKGEILEILLKYKKKALKLGRKILSVEFITTILEADSTLLDKEDFKFLGDFFYGKEDYSKALLYYSKWLNYDSTDVNTRINMAKSLEKLGDTIVAYNLLKGTEWKWNWRLKYEIGKLAYYIGLSYYNSGNSDSARVYLLETIEIGIPEVLQDKANFYMGNICYSEENYADAIKYYLKVIELNPFSNSPFLRKAEERIKLCKMQGG